ncbi:UPF0182 family protein [Leptolyngbya sp. AN02str]|uniref:UPF0182 family protein n=1 Tax=Leptolyngbya sp. AN02str TaxID=3423363 RepID=UPI003D30F3A8
MALQSSSRESRTHVSSSATASVGRSHRWWHRLYPWLSGGLGILILLDVLTYLLAEGFWFDEVGYAQLLWVRLGFQLALGLVVFVISLSSLWGNLRLAHRQVVRVRSPEDKGDGRSPGLRLRWLLPIGIILSSLMGFLLLYHGQIAVSHWQPNVRLYGSEQQVPANFSPDALMQVAVQIGQHPWLLLPVVALVVAVLLYPRFSLGAIALLMSLGFALVLSENWIRILPALRPVEFNRADPLFGLDVSFFVFQIPVLELLVFWLLGLFTIGLTTVALMYLLGDRNLSDGKFPGFTPPQVHHLLRLGGWFLLAIALNFWLDRYELVYSNQGSVYGAGFTDVFVRLPTDSILSIAALILGGLMLLQAFRWRKTLSAHGPSDPQSAAKQPAIPASPAASRPPGRYARANGNPNGKFQDRARNAILRQPPAVLIERHPLQPIRPVRMLPSTALANVASVGRSLSPARASFRAIATPFSDGVATTKARPWLLSVVAYTTVALLSLYLLPAVVQNALVQPNELELELPYLERAITLTRESFELDKIQSDVFNPSQTLTEAGLAENDLTISNIRLWDARPLLLTNRQLQRFRPYYEFADADIDRYLLPTDNEDGRLGLQQVLISARELDYNSVPASAKTWVNQHLIYTHGYGFTLTPVNTAAQGGLPEYFVEGIEQIPSDPRIRESIPLDSPRIYYGELANTYVMTQTRVLELDYPSGSENVYNSYDGRGGVSIGAYWRRLVYAKHLRDWRMLFSAELTPQSRLLFRRNINSRVKAIAPFLRYDSDPYLVVANVGWSDIPGGASATDPAQTSSHLYWMLDAYTTSDRYPYADPNGNDFNYIRNSVKVVMDAYNGTVWFFVANAEDPIIRTWSGLFPGMFRPLEQMPATLRSHLRYPVDFYDAQSRQLMVYHMTDPRVFYNREDQWRSPNETYGDQQQPVEPYYLILNLPTTGTSEEFILLRPFSPLQRTNLIAWLAARTDGDNYGRMLLYRFPKQELVFGTEQIEARINQDPVISQQISLWNRRGSRAIQGNLLVIPIEDSLLYVEPLYLEAEQNQLPTLVRVIVAYGNQIAMAETLDQALSAVFANPSGEGAIVRPLEGDVPADTEFNPELQILEESETPVVTP